jgi:twitching motility protein PilT
MIETALQTLREIAASIPDTGHGLERQMLIGDLVAKQSPAERTALRKLMDSYLLRMAKINASDIDLGGYGSGGHIWYRVYGDKKPDKELSRFTFDEFNVLVQSILIERQRLFLYENRNLDFSYSIIVIHKFNIRFFLPLPAEALPHQHTLNPPLQEDLVLS